MDQGLVIGVDRELLHLGQQGAVLFQHLYNRTELTLSDVVVHFRFPSSTGDSKR